MEMWMWILIVNAMYFFGLIVGAQFWRKRKHIYWNAKEGQIMTRGGECLYDRQAVENSYISKVSELTKRVYALEQEDIEFNRKVDADNVEIDAYNDKMGVWESTVEAQLQCQAKCGHKMVFRNKHDVYIGVDTPVGSTAFTANRGFIFKCQHCGLEITKTEKELKTSEREALKKLKLILKLI